MTTTTEELKFEESPSGGPTTFLQDFKPGNKRENWNPMAGDDVALKYEGETVNVKISLLMRIKL